ncbi:MAG TPA: hypothetical protein VED20_14055 [Streptosporangiaceae bacterium]|nr:hypothetical protein [Streptosporangiaceae bacterium]
MTVTICIRIPCWQAAAPPGAAGPAASCSGEAEIAAVRQILRWLLPLAEPTALLVAEAAGLGFIGKLLVCAAFRSRHPRLPEPARGGPAPLEGVPRLLPPRVLN